MDEVFNTFQASSAPSMERPGAESFGQYLRRHRLAHHVSIEEMSWATKIKPEYLAALESGDLTCLPGETFTRGYLRTYAQYVGLDPKEVLSRFVQSDQTPSPICRETNLPERFSLLSWLFSWLDRLKRLLTGREDEQVY